VSEDWRIKRYNPHRILIDVADTLESPYTDCAVCLTAGELNILRNLLGYAHWRSTWASERHDTYYLAPTEAEWDHLDALVAGLESKLMNCEEFSDKLDQLLELLTNPIYGTPILSGYVQNQVDGGVMTYDEFYGQYISEADAERCAIAQLTWALGYSWLTETIQPAEQIAVDVLLPAVLEALATMIGTPVLAVSASPLVIALTFVVNAWAQGQLANVINGYTSNKLDLVCAVYNGLGTGDFRDAEAAARVVIDSIDGWTAIDKLVGRALFAPWALAQCQQAYINDTEWAQDHVSAGYCLQCDVPSMPLDIEFSFPPTTDWLLGSGPYYDANGHLDIPGAGGGDRIAYSPSYLAPTPSTYSVSVTGTGRGVDSNLGVMIFTSPDGDNWTLRWTWDFDTTTAAGCLAVGPKVQNCIVPAGTMFVRFALHNRTTDTNQYTCSVRFVFT
jgi:hypothetical protein